MVEIDTISHMLPQQIAVSLENLASAKDVNEKKVYSEIVLNLSKSMGVILEAMNHSMDDFDDDDLFDEFDDDDDDDLPAGLFGEDDDKPVLKLAPKGKGKGKGKGKNDFF